MNYLLVQSLLISQISVFGIVILQILGSIVVILVSLLIFDFGWRTLVKGKTSYLSSKIMFLDHAPFTKPYKTYNRLHSQSWNIKNTL